MFNRARAFSPAGISSFFEICDMTSDGKLILEPELVGARGGGFSPCKGVLTEVVVSEAEESRIQIYINKKFCSEAKTTKSVVEMLTGKVTESYDVCVMHKVEVPVAAGFGSSAAGALGTALALNKILKLNLTYNQLGKVAHVAEVNCKTGFGTVGPLLFGGCGLTLEPGAPGIARLDRIPVSSDHRLVMGTFGSYSTKELLASGAKRGLINTWGRKTLKRILVDSSLENFMNSCKKFAFGTGFATERVKKLMDLAEKAGAIGVAQNMLGEAVHALVKVDSVDAVYAAFKKLLPEEKIMISAVASHGAHIIG